MENYNIFGHFRECMAWSPLPKLLLLLTDSIIIKFKVSTVNDGKIVVAYYPMKACSLY